MQWKKLGRVFDPTGQASWMHTHAALPFAVPYGDDNGLVRVFCGGRDAEGRGQTGYADIRLTPEGAALVEVSRDPVIGIGALGTFDDRGALPSCVVDTPDGLYHYYTGVMLGQTVPFYYFVGLAIGGKDAAEKWSSAPLLPFAPADPYLTASPYVLREDDRWRMWYMSGVRWTIEDGVPKHYYHLKYAESDDGMNWNREGRVAIDFADGEHAISRPSVLPGESGYRMWFASRGSAYRINYAESLDGLTWERKIEPSRVDVSEEGWDSEMVCYPHVFRLGGNTYMLYNGNAYGKTGFGAAVLV